MKLTWLAMTPGFSPTGPAFITNTGLAEMSYTVLLESPQTVFFLYSPIREGCYSPLGILHEGTLLVLVVTPPAGA